MLFFIQQHQRQGYSQLDSACGGAFINATTAVDTEVGIGYLRHFLPDRAKEHVLSTNLHALVATDTFIFIDNRRHDFLLRPLLHQLPFSHWLSPDFLDAEHFVIE